MPYNGKISGSYTNSSSKFLSNQAHNIRAINNNIHGGKWNSFGAFGHEINTASAARYGLAFGLGAVALRNAQDSYHKLKYGEIGGSMLSAALGTAAAAGAFHMATKTQAMNQVLNFTGIRLAKAARFLSKGIK
jgi:hypothetical protein